MGEGRSKKGSVDLVRQLRDVKFFALGAVDLDAVLAQLVTHTVGHHALLIAQCARAVPVRSLQILTVDQGQP